MNRRRPQTVSLRTSLIAGGILLAAGIVARYLLQATRTGAASIMLPVGVDQTITLDVKGQSKVALELPQGRPGSYPPVWVSVMVDGHPQQIADYTATAGLVLDVTKTQGTIVVVHQDAGPGPIGGAGANTVKTINYVNANMARPGAA